MKYLRERTWNRGYIVGKIVEVAVYEMGWHSGQNERPEITENGSEMWRQNVSNTDRWRKIKTIGIAVQEDMSYQHNPYNRESRTRTMTIDSNEHCPTAFRFRYSDSIVDTKVLIISDYSMA